MNPVDPETDMRKLLWANFRIPRALEAEGREETREATTYPCPCSDFSAAVIQRHTWRFLTTLDQIMNQDTWTIVGLVVTNVFLFLLVMGMWVTCIMSFVSARTRPPYPLFFFLLYMHFCSNNDTKGEHSGHSKHAPTAAQFQGRLHWSLLPIHPAAIFGVCRRRNLSIAAQRGDYLDYCC